MARAETYTWLSLDEWAKILGLNPLHFNQLDVASLFPNTTCGEPVFQYAWQNADRVSREDIANAIREAETKIAGELGYNLIPDWIEDERRQTVRPANPNVYNVGSLNVRGQRKSVETYWGHVISGGKRASSLIEAGVTVVRSDADGDGYDELCTIAVTTTVTDANEIRVYFPGEAGADEWEVRPIKVSISGGVATITFNSWLIVDPNLMEAIDADSIDPTIAGNYVSTVDVYRVYNDPQTQVQLLWEPLGGSLCDCLTANCQQCEFSAQNGCLMVRDSRLGMVTYAPATWDGTEFDSAGWAVNREPDRLRLWYYSGWRNNRNARPNVEMDKFWAYAVAYYAASLLDRPVCACDNSRELIERWSVDASRVGSEVSFQVTPSQLENNLGTSMGALYALRRVRENGRRIGR